MSALAQRYNVGGVLLPRPFKLRRLGHFGFNVADIETSPEFYGDLIGFTASDKADFSRAPWFPKDAGLGRDARLFQASRHRSSRAGPVFEAGHGPPRRPQIRVRGHDQSDPL